MAAHGRDKFHTLKEAQAMHEFIHKVEQGADKKALLDEIIQANKAKISEFLELSVEQEQPNVKKSVDYSTDNNFLIENQEKEQLKKESISQKDIEDDWDIDR